METLAPVELDTATLRPVNAEGMKMVILAWVASAFAEGLDLVELGFGRAVPATSGRPGAILPLCQRRSKNRPARRSKSRPVVSVTLSKKPPSRRGFLSDSGDNPPADRFNTGQKIVFWSVVLGGLALLASGLMLMFPFFWAGYDGMQWAQLAHGIIGLLMIALIFGHIYIGTVGMQDAFSAMWSGKVDRNWLKEHHSVWFRKITGNDRNRIGPAE